MFITDWPMSLKQRLPGSDESRGGKVERSGVKDVVVHLKITWFLMVSLTKTMFALFYAQLSTVSPLSVRKAK